MSETELRNVTGQFAEPAQSTAEGKGDVPAANPLRRRIEGTASDLEVGECATAPFRSLGAHGGAGGGKDAEKGDGPVGQRAPVGTRTQRGVFSARFRVVAREPSIEMAQQSAYKQGHSCVCNSSSSIRACVSDLTARNISPDGSG